MGDIRVVVPTVRSRYITQLLLCASCILLLSTASPDTVHNDKPIEDVDAFLDITYFDHRNHTPLTTRIVGMFGLNSQRIAVRAEVIHVRSRYGDHDGCDVIDDWNIPSRGSWIALAVRGECSFEQKITNLHKRYNASAVLIYNNVKEPLFIINHSRMPVVSVLINKKDGEYIGDLFDSGVVVKMTITSSLIIERQAAADEAAMKSIGEEEYRRSRAVMAVSILVICAVCVAFIALLISTVRSVMMSSHHKTSKSSYHEKHSNKKSWPILSEA